MSSFTTHRSLDGIFAHLAREWGGNIHKKGVVKVTANSCDGDYGKPEHVVDLTSDRDFYSGDEPNSWICYDFRGQGRDTDELLDQVKEQWASSAHPRSWVLEVSDSWSEGSWEVVDSCEDNSDLNDSLVIRNFAISTPASGIRRFVRLRQTGKNHYGTITSLLTRSSSPERSPA